MTDDRTRKDELELLRRTLSRLEERISKIEKHINLEPIVSKEEIEPAVEQAGLPQRDTLEMQIGLYWFAKVGIVVFLVGIVFLLMEPFESLPRAFGPILGFVIAAAATMLSRFLGRSSSLLSGYMLGGGLVLFFVSGLRLHYFSAQPLLTSVTLELILLLVIAGVSIAISVRRVSVYTSAVSITMLLVAGLLSDNASVLFPILFAVSALTVYLKLKQGWNGIMIFGMSIVYFSVLEWSLNNPLAGNTLQLRPSGYPEVISVMLILVVFASGNYLRGKNKPEDVNVILSSLLNAALAYSLFSLLTVPGLQNNLAIWHVLASIFLLFLAAAFWMKERSKFQTFFYAMTGYAALSLAIVAQFKTPESFVWLCWQSLLVVSTAIWFRSKFIVVTNFVIYSIIFVFYLVLAGTVSITSLSFGVVALMSARILNWQKHRLDLKTEIIRNAYLVAAFVIFPYALYHAIPSDYVGLSWIGVATVYYVISLVLKNVKYRWMSLLTFLLSAVYLVIVGIAKLGPFLRIVSFVILGLALLVVSFIYARAKVKSASGEN